MTPGFSTEFEELVFEKLTKANFRTIQHAKVGEYVVDLVVEGGQGKRVAIQCDGDRRQDDEEIAEAMERQLTLERLGWKFIRLRGSEFFRNPDEVIKKLARRLKEIDIEPVGPKADAPPSTHAEDLKQKVIKRAELIRSRWKESELEPRRRKEAA